MRLRDVFLYLYNTNSNNLEQSNIQRESVVIQSDGSILINLEKEPLSKDHIFFFRNGNFFTFDFEVHNKQVIFESGTFQENDVLNLFYFSKIPQSHPDIGEPLQADVFNGGDDHYILSIGALDRKAILVTKNGKIQNQYDISNGVLTLYGTYSNDRIVVFYLNRGFVERRAKLSLSQLDTSSVDTRYAVNGLVYNKPEIDNIICNLRNNAPIGIMDLRNYAEVVGNFKNQFTDIVSQIENLANENHHHDSQYYNIYQIDQMFNKFVNLTEVYQNSDIDNLVSLKANLDQVYTRDEIDLMVLTSRNEESALDRALFIGGAVANHSDTNSIEYININNTSDAVVFGTFQISRRGLTATSNGKNNLGMVFGGSVTNNTFGTTSIYTMSFINACGTNFFGDMDRSRIFATASSNGTNGIAVVFGGDTTSRDIEFRVIGTRYTSGGLFGELSNTAIQSTSAAMSNGKNDRIVFGPVVVSESISNLEYITPSTLGNSKHFGRCTPSVTQMSGTSNDVNDRGVLIGGVNLGQKVFVDSIEYVNLPVLSVSVEFGKLITPKSRVSSVSNGTGNRALIAGGNVGTTFDFYNYTRNIEYITIDANSNSSEFGTLTISRGDGIGSCSNSSL